MSKSTFPESANNNEMARHLYYLGRIKAIQLEYSAAHQHLMQVLIISYMYIFSQIVVTLRPSKMVGRTSIQICGVFLTQTMFLT